MTQSIIHQSIAPSPCEDEGDWYGLYKGNTSQDDHLFDPASTRHPAKMSLALTNKILDQMQEWGWIENGSLVVDPFGGRGTTALCWLARNAANRALTVELEPHFVEMQNRNKEHAERRLHRELAWVILQGDSRRFDEYYAEGKAASVLSPPWENSLTSQVGFSAPHDSTGLIKHRYTADSAITSAPYVDALGHRCQYTDPEKAAADDARDIIKSTLSGQPSIYGQTPGQIGRLKDPPAASVLSAPYAAAENRRAAGNVQEGEVSDAITRAYDATNHGQTAGNIANLPDAALLSAPWEKTVATGDPDFLTPGEQGKRVPSKSNMAGYTDPAAAVTSAPFEDSLASDDPDKRGGFLKSDPKRRNDPGLTATYGDAAAVTSAPWNTANSGSDGIQSAESRASRANAGVNYRENYGEATGQIGVLQSENYADACGKVYASLAKAGIRYVASVTKDPVKNKKLRPLRLLTISLFEQAGYRLVAWRRAHLFATEGEENERAGQGSLFGDELEESKRLVGRLSFFRRLSLAKGGIAARWEDALFFRLADPAEQQTTEKPVWVQPELPGTA